MKGVLRILLLLCGIGVALGPFPSQAESTNLPPAADTFINSGSPNNNAGATGWFDAGEDGTGGVRRGLLRFDLSAIPAGSTVTSAVLRLTLVKVPSTGGAASTVNLFRLLADWGEGNKSGNAGAPASPGEATWNARLFGQSNWSAPGAANDALDAPSASTAIGSQAGTTFSWTGSNLVNDVQYWVDNPGSNFGWLLRSDAEAIPRSVRGFASRESGVAAGKLEIGYTTGATLSPPAFTAIYLTNTTAFAPAASITNGSVFLQWQGDPNAMFDLLYSTSLGSNTSWQLAQPNIQGSASGSNSLQDVPFLASPAYSANSNLFYRLAELPPPAPGLQLGIQVIASNFVSPTVLTYAPDGSGRRFVADQTGQIWILPKGGGVLPTPFLDISNRMVTLHSGYDERGLLGLAFHPGYATNGRFFVYYAAPPPNTNYDNQTVLSEFHVSATDSNLADPASERILLKIPEPEFNHEGAALHFGPDGYLYLAPGDGGGAGDQHGPLGDGQVLTNLLGKMLRIDVDSGSPYAIPPDNPFINIPGARPEIYAYGLRNPWRFSFDRGGTHQGFIADVGQNLWEEVDLLRKGANYGWRIMEGDHAYDLPLAATLGVSIASLDFPIFEYEHGPIGIAIIGGFVYRGTAYPALVGKYVFGDFSTGFSTPDGHLYYLDQTRPGIWQRFAFQLGAAGQSFGRFIKGFGEDQDGELYVLSTTELGPSGSTGDVRLLTPP